MQRCCELARCFIAVSNQRARQLVKKNKLHAPGEEAYKHLKAAVSGGPSIVLTRYHEAGFTRIRSHENTAAKPCKRIFGYDANALYLSTMLNDMPCGKKKVIDYEVPVLAAIELKNAIINGKLFGFVKCKLATQKKPCGQNLRTCHRSS